MAVLTDSQLKRLKEHKYCAEGRSISEPLFQPFWNYVVSLVPLWVAPNLITIVGLLLNALSAATLILYSPQAKSNDVPSSIFYFCAVGLFLYQTLDAIDGKQARRTGSSSPMGELFDHGCDAVSTTLVTMSFMCAVSLGTYKNHLFFVFINNAVIFYVAHWQTYCTGKLMFGIIDVTEIQVNACVAFVIAGLYQPSFFLQQVPFLPYNISYAKSLACIVGIGSFWYYSRAFSVIFHGGCGKNGTTVAKTSVLSPVVPLGIVAACAFYVFKHSADKIFVTSPCLFMAMFGCCFAKLTCNLVVASMSKSQLDMLDCCMIGPLFLSCYIYFGVNSWLAVFNFPVITEFVVLQLCFVFSLANFVRYCALICMEISDNFGIAIFTIVPKKID